MLKLLTEKEINNKKELINEIRNLYPNLRDFYLNQNIIKNYSSFKAIFYSKMDCSISLKSLIELKEIASELYGKK